MTMHFLYAMCRPAEAGVAGASEGLELLSLEAVQCLSTMGGFSGSAEGHEDSRPPGATLSPAFRVPPPPFTLPPAPEPFRQLLNWRFHDLRVVMGSNIQVRAHPSILHFLYSMHIMIGKDIRGC